MALDVAALSAEVAARMGRDIADATGYVDAAALYVSNDTGVAVDALPANDALLNPGIVLLAMRIGQDTPIPGRATEQFDPVITDSVVAKRLYAHLDEYWRHLTVNFGIA